MSPSPANPSPCADSPKQGTPAATASRLAAIDWLRGFVMIVMTVDHAADNFYIHRLFGDMADTGIANSQITDLMFWPRWVTHLCAPTFVFLAGLSLMLSLHQRQVQGKSLREFDRDLLKRAGVLLFFEATVVNLTMDHGVLLQVLYAIGVGFVAMIGLRRLAPRTLAVGLVLWLIGSEWLTQSIGTQHEMTPLALFEGLTIVSFWSPTLIIAYPVLHWLAVMVMGWLYGYFVVLPAQKNGDHRRLIRQSASLTLLCIAVFFALRGFNGYGNLGLLREGHSLIDWLRTSKYPPSLTYLSSELALAGAILVWRFCRKDAKSDNPLSRNPMMVFGQSALFFYVLHLLVLALAKPILAAFGIAKGPLSQLLVIVICVLVLCYPCCSAYRRLKQRYPRSLLRLI